MHAAIRRFLGPAGPRFRVSIKNEHRTKNLKLQKRSERMPLIIDSLVAGLNRIADVGKLSVMEDFAVEPPIGLSPWGGWALVGALRHLAYRQVINVLLKKHVFPQPNPESQFHVHDGRRAYLPGSPNLEYEISDCGIDVHDRSSGKRHWTNLSNGTRVSAFDLITTLSSTKQFAFPEQRLCDLHASMESVYATVQELNDEEVTGVPGGDGHDEIELGGDINALIDAWSRVEPLLEIRENRLCLAALLNDSAFILQELNADERSPHWSDQHETNLARRRQHLHALLRDERWAPHALHALSDIDDPGLETAIEVGLRSDRLKGYLKASEQRESLVIVRKRRMSKFYPVVRELVRVHGARGTLPRLGIWRSALELLFEAGQFLPELVRELESPPRDFFLWAAEMSLRYAPSLSRKLFRQALEWGNRGLQETAAGVLAILDEPWSRELLLTTMAETDDRRLLRLCEYALLESCDHEVHTSAKLVSDVRLREEPKSSILKAIDVELFHRMISYKSEEIFPLRGRVK